MESYSVKAVLSVTDKNFTQKMEQASGIMDDLEVKGKRASSGIMDIAKGVGAFKALSIAGNTLKASLDGAINRFDTMNRFPRVMQQIGFTANESNVSINKLSDGIQGLPTTLDGIVASTQNIAVLTKDLDKATATSIALNDAFLASGSASEAAERGLTQYVQMLSKGEVDLESWRTLQETMGPALYEVAEAFGFAGTAAQSDLYAALKEGEITFDQFNDKLIELDGGVNGFAERARTASGGIRTSFENIGTAVVRGVESVIRTVDNSLTSADLPGFQEMLDGMKEKVNAFFNEASGGAEKLVGVVAPAVRMVRDNLDILVPVLGTAASGFVTYKAAMDIGERVSRFQKSMADAVDTIQAMKNASELAARATKLQEAATVAAELAETRGTAARKASLEAIRAQAAAKELAVKASKAQAKADKLAEAASKAKSGTDKAVAKAESMKAAAASAKAETLSVAASEASARADKKAAAASEAKALADKAETMATNASTAAETVNTAAETAGAKAAAVSSTAIAAKTALLGVLSGKLGVVAAAQMVWNTAMAANPIGATIVTMTALVTVLVGVSKAVAKFTDSMGDAVKAKDEAVKSSKELIDSLESSSKAYEANVSDIDANVKVNKELASSIASLSAKEGKSAEDKAKLKASVETLNASMEGLNLQYDEETDALSVSTDALMKKVEAYEAEAKAQAAQERYLEVKKEQIKVDEEHAALMEKMNGFEKEWQALNNSSPKAIGEHNKAMKEMEEQLVSLDSRKKELAESESYLKGVMVESQQAQAEAVSSGVAVQITSLEQLDDETRAVVEGLNDTWSSYAEQATNMFDVLSDKSEISVSKMTQNLQENQRIISQWADNIKILAERGIDQGLLEQLRSAGPESAGYVNAMVQASDAELQQLSEAFANGGTTATNALKTAFDTSGIPESVMGLVTTMEESLNSQMAAVDWAGIGMNVDRSLADSMSGNSGFVKDAGAEVGTAAEEGTKGELGIGSPSRVFQGYGLDTVQGFINGVNEQSGALNATMQAVMSAAGNAAKAAMDQAVVEMGSKSGIAFHGITAAAQSSMSSTARAVASGMTASSRTVSTGTSSMQRAMKAGMSTMSATVKTGMAGVTDHGTSGMRRFTKAVETGMNQSRANVSRGTSGMVSEVSAMQPRFYSSGYHASMGLANGINAGAGAAIAAANRVANQVSATMRSALQVHSPSRVTKKIGGYTTEGFVEGLLEDIREVRDAALRIGKAALPVNGAVDRVSYAGGYASGGMYDLQCGAAYTFVIPLKVEGREIARATAVYTKEELDDMEFFENYRKGYR